MAVVSDLAETDSLVSQSVRYVSVVRLLRYVAVVPDLAETDGLVSQSVRYVSVVRLLRYVAVVPDLRETEFNQSVSQSDTSTS